MHLSFTYTSELGVCLKIVMSKLSSYSVSICDLELQVWISAFRELSPCKCNQSTKQVLFILMLIYVCVDASAALSITITPDLWPSHHYTCYILKAQTLLTSVSNHNRHAWKHGATLPEDSLLTETVRKTRSRSTQRTVDQCHLHTAFSQDFIPWAGQGLEGTFIQHRGSLYTSGYTRELQTKVNVTFRRLGLLNVMPSTATAVKFHSKLGTTDQTEWNKDVKALLSKNYTA